MSRAFFFFKKKYFVYDNLQWPYLFGEKEKTVKNANLKGFSFIKDFSARK